MNEISEDALNKATSSFEDDCNYRFTLKSVDSDAYSRSKEIIQRYGNEKSIRTLDALQLSVSLNVLEDTIFVSSDELLVEIAKQENLKILNQRFPLLKSVFRKSLIFKLLWKI